MSKAAIAEKEKFVDAFAEELKAAKAILVINYLGLTVEEVTNMRKELRDNDVKMKVIKNTYLRRAAAKAGIEGLDDTFVGPTAVIYTDNADDVTEPARIVSKYEDDFDVIEIKGGMLEGRLLRMKSRNLLLSQAAKVCFQCLFLYYKLLYATSHMLLRLLLNLRMKTQLNNKEIYI